MLDLHNVWVVKEERLAAFRSPEELVVGLQNIRTK